MGRPKDSKFVQIQNSESTEIALLQLSKRLRQLTEEQIENIQKVIENRKMQITNYQSIIDLPQSADKVDINSSSKSDECKNKIRELTAELADDAIMLADYCDLLAKNCTTALQQFDTEEIPVDVRKDYTTWESGYEKTQNNHYVIEIFTRFVRIGMNPPAWVMNILADGFHEHMRDTKRDPQWLAKRLGLQGAASGKTNPWRARKLRSDRSPAMADMGMLVSSLKISKNRAAKAVKIKYELDESISTLKKYFVEYFGEEDIPGGLAAHDHSLNQSERTRLVSSFPVAARKLFNK